VTSVPGPQIQPKKDQSMRATLVMVVLALALLLAVLASIRAPTITTHPAVQQAQQIRSPAI
jgi:hypothetical protein